MKVAIVYDRVNKFGGAERVLLALHEMFPDAPLFTSVYAKNNASWAKVFPKIIPSFLNKIEFLQNNHEFLFFFMPFVFQKFNFDEYDLVISVTSEFAKNINVKNGIHICYCLTPTRYLWSHHEEYFGNKFLRLLAKSAINYLRKIDKSAAKKPDVLIAISSEVQKRIKRYYKRDSEIIFPPVPNISLSRKKLLNRDYFLVVSRLVRYKKVDLVIKAFNELRLPLIVIGTGREERKLRKMANGNISFLGHISDNELASYYKNAKALIFPQEEDFGITAVEAQSFGIPVIAYKKGGSLDTVTDRTGVFFEQQTKESLGDAIKKFQKMKFNRNLIRKNAERFSKEKFQSEFLEVVKNL